MPQCVYSVQKSCQLAVGSPWNMPKYQIARHSVHTTSLQRPHDVPTASLQPPWRSCSAQEDAAACSQRAHGARTAGIQRSHGDDSVLGLLFIFYFEQHKFANIVTYLDCSKQFFIVFNTGTKSRSTSLQHVYQSHLLRSVHREDFITMYFNWGLFLLNNLLFN